MIKYRVYIQKAMEEVACGWENGDLNVSTGAETYSGTAIRSAYIPIEDTYYFLTLFLLNNSYTFNLIRIFLYDSSKTYIENSMYHPYDAHDILFNRKQNFLSAKYIRMSIYQLIHNDRYLEIRNYIDNIVLYKKNKPVLLHDSSIPEKEYHLINANLHIEDSVAGSLEFVLTKHHPYYTQKLNFLTDTLYVTRTYKDGSERTIWDGRPISEDVDTEGSILYHCEGALSYLNDTRTISGSKSGKSYISISDFINDFILYRLNNSNSFIICDRTFRILDNNTYTEYSDLNINNDKTYLIATNYDSGLKLIEDFKESFNAHFKVKYSKNSDIQNDQMYRCLSGFNDFDGLLPVKRIYIVGGKCPVSRRDINPITDKDAAYIKRGEVFYIGSDSGYIYYMYTANVSFWCTRPVASTDAFADTYPGYVTTLYSHLDSSHPFPSGYTIQDSKNYEMDATTGNIVKRLYYKSLSNRFPHLKASFGLNIFSAQKNTEVVDVATCIIPHGIEYESSSGIQTNLELDDTNKIVEGKPSTIPFDQKEKPPASATDISGAKLFDYELIKKYGVIEAVVNFEEADTPKKLYYQGLTWFRELKKNIVRRNVEISLYDLTRAITYDSTITNVDDLLADPEYLDIWTQIEATIPELGITEDDPEKYYISALDIPLDNWIETQVSLVNTAELLSKQRVDAGYVLGSSKGIIDTSS